MTVESKCHVECELESANGVEDTAGLDEGIDLLFMDIEIFSRLFCIHQFAGHGLFIQEETTFFNKKVY